MLISPLKDTWHMLPLVGNNEKTYAHVGEKEPERGWLLLGDIQPLSEQRREAPSLPRQFSFLCAVKITSTSLYVQNLYKT
jgi:hypothetical protein